MRDFKAKAVKILRDMENLRKSLGSVRGEADDTETYRLIKALDMAICRGYIAYLAREKDE